jgi:predicted ester cyclase
MEEDAMAANGNQAVLRRFSEIVNSGELEALDEVFSPDYALKNAQTMSFPPGAGRELVKSGFARMHRAFPDDARWTLSPIAEDGDTIVASWTFRGTNTGPYDRLGPTGREVAYPVIAVYRFRDGQIVESWGVFDSLAMWRELIPEIGELVDTATG